MKKSGVLPNHGMSSLLQSVLVQNFTSRNQDKLLSLMKLILYQKAVIFRSKRFNHESKM